MSGLPWVVAVCGLLAFGAAGAQSSGGATVSGRWVGVLDTVKPDGSVAADTVYFELKQDGAKVSGGAGQGAAKLSPVSTGTVLGMDVALDVAVSAGMTVHFALRAEGDHLVGEATGLPGEAGSKFVVNVARWAAGAAAPAVMHTEPPLFRAIAAMDAKLFGAYNQCDLKTLGELVSDDLEFYHDKTGLAVGRKPFVDSIQQNICGRVQRTLVEGSMEVYPMANFGALEFGSHRFTHPGHPEEGVGEAKFVTVWQKKDGRWIVTRVLSYDHGAMLKK